ncbi:MAG TPA: GNAT family N-acetyltransferase [Acidimicrobiales bacterium]|nr:GNAT family N-acetyltransferase [Acidimicrobiales bacterium]
MTLTIEIVESATDEVRDALNSLVPQLSSRAVAIDNAKLASIIENPSLTLLVARESGAILGTLTLAVFPIPSGEIAMIEDVVVDESARGLGAGEALVTAAIAHAASLGAREVDLTSRPSRKAANALYQKIGFEQRETNVYRFFIES